MSVYIRKDTFILSDQKSTDTMSGIDRQNVMRLRINRIALVQELKIDHIIGTLIEHNLINNNDQKKIGHGTTHADRARILIDLLPSKTSIPEWYSLFRDAMLNPDAGPEVRKRYRSLVEFLDNTVIHRPTSQATKFSETMDKRRLPHYEPVPPIIKENKNQSNPQNVLNLDDERREAPPDQEMEKQTKDMIPERGDKSTPWNQDNQDSMTLIKGFFQQWVPTPDNFRSLLQVPEDHFQALQESTHPDDKAQLALETKALEKIRKLELVAVLARRKQLPQGFELCMCDVVHEILFDSENYHLFFKYIKNLQDSEVHLLSDIVDSYSSVMQALDPSKSGDDTKQAIKLGYHLIDFLAEFGYFKEAELIMAVLLVVLNQTDNMETWMTKYKGFVKLMRLRNMNYNFSGSYSAYSLATEMMWKIKMMSFGQDLIPKAELYNEICQMMLERGSVNAAFGWAQKALKEVQETDTVNVINILCTAVVAYSAKWQVKRAEQLAIHAVQQARSMFGPRHPLYLKALLAFCHFSNEFKQDQAGLDVAQHALEVAQKIYGCDMIMTALAHRAVCKALLVLQKFDDFNYDNHANEGLRKARILLRDNHPMLYLFLHTAATALQWKALHSSKDMMNATLTLAETEAKIAISIVEEYYGEISVRAAQMNSLLGQIYSKMDRLQDAEKMLYKSAMCFKLCLSPNSNFRLLSMATLGTFYKIFDKPKEAILMFNDVITNIEPCGVYLKWVHVCFEHLVSTLQSINLNKEADEVQIKLSQWLRDHPVYDHVVTVEDLQQKPQAFARFQEDFNIWEKRTKKILDMVLNKDK
ncbi:amyloid protein-binding protein 2-like [Mizuhopecten yessoensis]|uniref:Amyloid protein-binding protein 2 n=1 Tax=Mizuhopecten yessoensis TaxID=6573 RepID=A0A210PHT5_MIZYE|nr:amyloid protein-binding protein 2-like [Mizuhopecten yessoensis]OWF36041.1 Amyloid protein-binding protein 2 [Mizuhopecten yessoensis]